MGKDISREERFNEPDRPSAGVLSDAEPWAKYINAFDSAPQVKCSNVFMFGLGF